MSFALRFSLIGAATVPMLTVFSTVVWLMSSLEITGITGITALVVAKPNADAFIMMTRDKVNVKKQEQEIR